MKKKASPAPRVFSEWPATFYGPEGHSAQFNSPLEVPEGWHDSPAKVGDPNAVTEIPGYDEAVAAAESKVALLEEGVADEEDADNADAGNDSDGGTGDDDGSGGAAGDDAGADGEPAEALPPIDKITKAQISERLTALKVAHNPSWKEQRLYDLLKDNLNKGA